MLILQDILSQEIVQRLGWTLLHFIWQAAAVALILTILLRVLRKSTANLRYIIACLALALVVLLPVITIKLVPVSQPLTAAHFTPAPAPTVLPIDEMPAPETVVVAKPYQPESVTVAPAIPLKQRIADTLEPALPYIVSGWLIGVLGLSIWHLGGWTQLQRLKRRMVKQVDSTLLNKLKALTQKLKVKQTVQLMESALVQIPTVVGWLKPVILLPANALTGLSSEQLEAIIAHELAHIKRFDYLINILQTVVEILGFYHPAVWWVSHKIRAERENCCDDMAVSISGDRLSYAGALASMEEIRAAGGKLAVAATGGNLFRRICRLLGKDSTDNTGLSWVPAATAILLIIALAIPTTLALTNKSDSMLTEPQAELQVEDDMLIATAQIEESPAENISPDPVLTTSPAPPDGDKAQVVKANFIVIEVPLDSKIDTDTLKEAEKILGGKINLRNTKVDAILRQAANATAKDKSAESKRITEQQFNALVKMLDSKGCLKILMNPMIETLNGKTAIVKSTEHIPLQQVIKSMPDSGQIIRRINKNKLEVIDLRSNKNEYVDVVDLIEITPHVFEDGHIILDFKADLGSPKLPAFDTFEAFENTFISSRKLSTQVRANPGETLIIGGLVDNPSAPEEYLNISEKPANELLFIITPTILPPPNNSTPPAHILIEIQKVKLADKLKRFGVAVAMYADDHDDNLPESIQEIKPYLLDEGDFDWLRNNVEYFDKGKTSQRNAAYIPIAYDKTLLEKADGTNVLFLDFSVRFRQRSDFEQLDLKRAKLLIEARFLLVGEDFLKNINLEVDTWDFAQSNITPEKLKSLGFSKPGILILNDLDVNLLLSAVKKDSKVLAHPQILAREGATTEINTSKETDYIVDYTEPNSPSEKPQPIFKSFKEGIKLSLIPRLTENKNIKMQFESEISQVTGFKEKMYKGKYPYKLPTIQRNTQSSLYTAKDGQTLLFGGNKIADKWGGQSEQKDLLVLITAHTIYSSEQDKQAQAEQPAVVETTGITSKVITPPAISKSRTERRSDKEQKPSQVEVKEDFELPEITRRIESAKKLSSLGKALLIYANDNDDKYPKSLKQLSDYFNKVEDFHWVLENAAYLASGKTTADRPDAVMAYDKKLLIKEKGTNVLFNDCHVGFEKAEELKKLGINIIGNKFLIETWFLALNNDFIKNINHNADSPDEAKDLLKLKSELLAAVDGSNRSVSILPERNVYLLLKAVKAHKDSKVIATPHVICQEDKTADIRMSSATHYISGYIEPNTPSEEPQPKFDKAEEGITMSLKPKLTPNKNIDMQFNLEIIKVPGFEEKMYKGKYPYKLPSVQSIDQNTRYIAKDGQTLLFGIHKIADQPDNQTEQKDLLVLITTHTIGSSEQDKQAKTENLEVTEPKIILTRTEKPNINVKGKNKPATERRRRPARSTDDSLAKIDNKKQVTQIFSLKHHDTSQMARIVSPLLTKTGHVTTDKSTNSLIISDMAENQKRIEKIIAQYDVPKPDETITEIFEIRNGDPVEIVELLKKLINGRPDTTSVIESSNGPILLIPEPKRKWIIAKASPENINQIGQWIKKLDTDKSKMGLDPIDKAVHEQLEMIVDLSDLTPGMSFGEVVEILENSIEPPLQIQPIWKDLLDNAEVEQATPAGMDPLPHIKLRKALEILLTSVSSTGLPKLTYIVDEGVILIGTKDALPPKIVTRVYDISDPNELRMITERQQLPQVLPKIPKLPDKPKERMTPLEKIQKQMDELIKQRQAPKVAEPNLSLAPKVKFLSETFIDCPLIDALQIIAATANVTIIPDETVVGVVGLVSCKLKDVTVETALDIILAGTPYVWKKTPHYYLVASGGMFAQMSETHHVKMNYVTAEAAVDLLSTAFRDYVQAEIGPPGTETYTVVVTAPPALAERIISDLKQIDISPSKILIKSKLLSVSEDFLKDVGLDPNSIYTSGPWKQHLAAKYSSDPNSETYGLLIDDLHVSFLLKAVQANNDSKVLAAPQVLCLEGRTAQMSITTEEYHYVKGYNEPQDPSVKPQQKLDEVKIGTYMWLKPVLTPDNENVNLDFKLENSNLKGIIEGKYKQKYPYQKPIINKISTQTNIIIPDGKTMLIGGLKMNEHVTKKPGTPGLKDLPLIGAAFRSKDKPREQKMLLILIKPVINPEQKATKRLPIQEVSEEHIKRLAEQLDKKINPPRPR
ncbi:MAG: M48 family metalloprotease [Planctomycetes bacterium]|nr:M48 family metalloprotease [Planctomycetota bacterium]